MLNDYIYATYQAVKHTSPVTVQDPLTLRGKKHRELRKKKKKKKQGDFGAMKLSFWSSADSSDTDCEDSSRCPLIYKGLYFIIRLKAFKIH